ncbi:hypothetical protein ACQ4N7_20005 [Nodosilinea sp. AN01ver1]|uniref:hypothetical protein n=1 Tax=Nodosilinea sp. AN01ver1 TaxID=3423362 RepID=UPI003D30F2CF
MGRPSEWNCPTTAIRVPLHLAEHLKEIARQLNKTDNVQNPTEANHTPNGLPICKPAADAETIAQGLAEGWLVPKAQASPFMITSESSKGTFQLVVRPQPEPVSKVWADRLAEAEEMFGTLTTDEQWLMLGRLVEEWGQKVDG